MTDTPHAAAGRPGSREMRQAVPAPVLLAGCLYAMAIVGIVWLTLRPVFVPEGEGPHRYGIVAATGLAVGVLAALIAVAARRGPWLAAVLAFLGYVAAAVVVAIPGATTGGGGGVARGIADALRAPVWGWRDVVTLPVPLGEYEATLAVPLVLMVASGAAVTWAATRPRRWGMAAVIGGAAVVAAIALGPAARRELAELPGPLASLSREMVLGLLALAATVGWVLWRTGHERRRALAGVGGGVRGVRVRGRALGRVAMGAGVVALAVVSAAAVAVPVAGSQPREVGRSAIEPRLVVDRAVSPLSGYRAYFADDLYDAPLFTIGDLAGDVERVRIAALPFFDGSEFTAVAPSGYTPLRFQHVPSALAVSGDGVSATLTVDALEGPWAPLPGELGGVTFGGPRATALVDSFYYAPQAGVAVVALDGGVAAGDAFTASAAAAPDIDLAQAGPSPGAASVPADLIPQSLRDWVEAQGVTRDGAGLATLVDRLRSRGYLSHGLTDEGNPRWLAELGAYTFEPSAAGHSYDRLDRLFAALVEREAQVGPGAPDAALVAATGDDEQFAAAAALLAAELGFPSRVVVGARLLDTDPRGWTPPSCAEGVCRGRHMTAWAEVQSASGEWIPVDVTPQHTQPVTPSVASERDPELPTATDPDRAEAIDAVAALKGRSGGDDSAPAAPVAEPWFTGWVRVAVVGIAVLVMTLVPVVAIVIAKAVRRARRRRGTARAAAQGGWDEYVDAGIDAGRAPMPLATRRELAAAYGTRHGRELADIADRATFTAEGVDDSDARRAWMLVAADRAELRGRLTRWRRLGTRLSTRSLLGRSTAPRRPPATPTEHVDERWRAVRVPTSSARGRR